LFPGVSEEDILESERLEETMQEIERAEEKDRQTKRQARRLYIKYGKQVSTFASETKRFIAKQAILLTGFYAVYGLGLIATKNQHKNFLTRAVSTTDLQSAYNAYAETGSRKSKASALFMNPLKETYTFSNLFNQDIRYNPQPAPKHFISKVSDLRPMRAYVGLFSVIVFALAGLRNISRDKKRKIEKIQDVLNLWSNGNFEKINIENENDYQEVEIEQEERIVEMLERVVSHLSSQDATAFKKIMAGETNIPFDTAIHIMQGHLKTHPKDVQMVLETFEERSIPQDILLYVKEKSVSKTH